jgi:heme oxygenase
MEPAPDVLVMLREATAAAHGDAERHAFVRQLFGSAPSRSAYARYLAGLVEIYAALEDALAARREEAGFLADDRLGRREAISSDLRELEASLGLTAVPAPAAATAYAARIRDVAHDLPRLAAHAYVRYLGDLAGGQMMGKKVQAAFGEAPSGEAFDVSRMYRFEGFSSVRDASGQVRAELARLGAEGAARDAMVEEAVRGFALTTTVFAEIMQPEAHAGAA